MNASDLRSAQQQPVVMTGRDICSHDAFSDIERSIVEGLLVLGRHGPRFTVSILLQLFQSIHASDLKQERRLKQAKTPIVLCVASQVDEPRKNSTDGSAGAYKW